MMWPIYPSSVAEMYAKRPSKSKRCTPMPGVVHSQMSFGWLGVDTS